MDENQVDQAYQQLQQQGQQTATALSALAQKLQAAAASGNYDAREWALDLKEVALAIRDEEGQMTNLLQSMHAMIDSHMQQVAPAAPQPQYQQPQYQQPQYQQPAQYAQPAYGAPQGGGMLQRFLGSGFGRSIAMGAGFGIGDDIVNDIFR
ncbi:hypothetical protein [Gordonia polyisoprenivorans]|uniref:hypothetical protein n=1 Tax=Gordonia polyisoprenivorans TaxID=84595 RepID=UPI000B99EE48|nr:hypothetical protein [Gordonia polyisoprenivorans]OZC32526.1 hypothetical protein CJJ17_14305 [Gordonia polyisoprenivorans]